MRRVLIIGAGRSGVGVAKLLRSKKYEIDLINQNDFPERILLESMGISVYTTDSVLPHDKDVYEYVIKAPGISNSHPLVTMFDFVYNEIEFASMFSKKYHYHAITATNGKTTTSMLLYEMFMLKDDKALLAGNVGYALSEAVYQDGDYERDVALEIAAFQLEGLKTFKPEVFALMNLSPDHLDRYECADDYYKAKLSIIDQVGLFIRNIDDQNVMRLTQDYNKEHIDVSLKEKADVYLKDDKIYYKDIVLFKVETLKLVGEHNLMTAAFASIIAYKAGVSLDDIQFVISSFKGVEHRNEFVRELNGVSYYNDSKATNPESTEVALKAYESPIILLAGGFNKHISFDLLKPYENKLKSIIVFGESAQFLRETFPGAVMVDDMKEAIRRAQSIASIGDVVLLSPACASYDQFKNFEERGNIFKQIIKTLS